MLGLEAVMWASDILPSMARLGLSQRTDANTHRKSNTVWPLVNEPARTEFGATGANFSEDEHTAT